MSYALPDHAVTIAEFETFTDAQPEVTRWELVDGYILAMTNPIEVHGLIVTNIGFALKPAVDRMACRVNLGGLRSRPRTTARP